MEALSEEKCLRDRTKGDACICLILCAKDCSAKENDRAKLRLFRIAVGFMCLLYPTLVAQHLPLCTQGDLSMGPTSTG